LTRNSPAITISGFRSGLGRNDFEPVVRRRHPEVAEALDWLGRRATARLTGSGACVFAEFGEEATARGVFETLPPGWRGFIAKGCNRSLLLERLAAERSR
jgi:4-diphosphocytidyl-2-C-methyl-D-erythritol kinase